MTLVTKNKKLIDAQLEGDIVSLINKREIFQMPEKFLSMRDKFMKEGLSKRDAQEKAAKIFNSQRGRGTPPVTRKHHS